MVHPSARLGQQRCGSPRRRGRNQPAAAAAQASTPPAPAVAAPAWRTRPPSPVRPGDLAPLQAALAAGQRCFSGQKLTELDGGDLALSDGDLSGSGFRAARFGHAHLQLVVAYGCCFQPALLWGADPSALQAADSCWHQADLSATAPTSDAP